MWTFIAGSIVGVTIFAFGMCVGAAIVMSNMGGSKDD